MSNENQVLDIDKEQPKQESTNIQTNQNEQDDHNEHSNKEKVQLLDEPVDKTIKKRKIIRSYYISIPPDILINEISNNLELSYVRNLSLLSKYYHNIFTHKYFWYERFKNDFNNNCDPEISWEDNYKNKFIEFKMNVLPKEKLTWAIKNNYYPLVKKLMNIYINEKDIFNDALEYFLISVRNDNLEIFKLLSSFGLEFKKNILKLICKTCFNGSVNIFNYLSEFIDDYNYKCPELQNWNSPLYCACYGGNYEIVKLLIKNNAHDVRDENESSCLYIAAQEGHFKIVKRLLKVQYIHNFNNKFRGFSPLYVACRNGHIEVVEILLKFGYNPLDRGGDDSTPLYVACQDGHVEIVKLLLKNNINADDPGFLGYTPFYVASQNGHSNVVSELIKKGISLNRISPNGSTSLYIACQNGFHELVDILIKAGADISISYSDGYSPLYVACQRGHVDILKLLVNNGANINCQFNNGYTPLHISCSEGNIEIIKALLENGADKTIKDNNGQTALHMVCKEDKQEIVKLLLENGADKTIKDNNSKTAFELNPTKNWKELLFSWML
jgi:serine/threonine-protein phosphatase 6 regulatory ankyrin repeat subunit B